MNLYNDIKIYLSFYLYSDANKTIKNYSKNSCEFINLLNVLF